MNISEKKNEGDMLLLDRE